MKVYCSLPSGTYNITLSRDELVELVTTGCINAFAYRVPCEAGRVVYDGGKKTFATLDRKEVPNHLMFRLSNRTADMEVGDYGVQYLTIRLEGANND